MDRLRTPLLILALVLILIVVLIEMGTALPGVPGNSPPPPHLLPQGQLASANDPLTEDQKQERDRLLNQAGPPGLAIPSLAFIDSIVFFTIALMGVALLLPERLHGRVQGIVTLVFSLLLIIIALIRSFVAFSLLFLMIALLLAPLGNIVYLAVYGSFDRPHAYLILGIIMLLKFSFAVSIIFAQQRFLQNKGLVLLVITSLLCTIIVSFLHGIVPGFLVSITDAIAAIIVGIVAIIWGIVLFIGSIISIVKLLRLDRAFNI